MAPRRSVEPPDFRRSEWWNRIKEPLKSASTICPWPVFKQLVDSLTASNALRSADRRTVPAQVCLEYWFENQNCRTLRHPSRIAAPLRPLFPSGLGIYTRRTGCVDTFLLFSSLRQFVQPLLHPVLLDVIERLAVYSCCSAIRFATFIGECITSSRYTLSYRA